MKHVASTAIDLCKSTGFVSIYKPIAGWKAIHMWWNPEMGGFWEPYETSPFAFNTEQKAYEFSQQWAEELEIPYVVQTHLEIPPAFPEET